MSSSRQQKTIEGIYEHEHFVEFYEQDDLLLANLKNFIGAGLKEGSRCLVIATPEHRSAIDRMLKEEGLDADRAKRAGTYISLDAAATLAKFMVRGLPDRNRFRQLAGGLLDGLPDADKPIRCFGEMVALLWHEGNHTGAVLLEELWNELAREYSFTLFCAYPSYYFSSQAHLELQREISQLHSCTIIPEPFAETA